jgi:large subunit ribosomal protein L17
MAASLIQHGAIRTTAPKAKELRGFVEKIITIAKRGTLHARRMVIAEMGDRAMTDNAGEFLDKSVVQKLFDEVAPRYADRPGGYTRIIRLDETRIGDAGSQVILQLVEEGPGEKSGTETRTSRRRRRATKRHQAAAAIAERPAATADEAEGTRGEDAPAAQAATEDGDAPAEAEGSSEESK